MTNKSPSILLMDNSAHMFRGGGQLFVSQIEELLKKRQLGDVKSFNSDVIRDTLTNRIVCNLLDRMSRLVADWFHNLPLAQSLSNLLRDLSYMIRLVKISRFLKKGTYYDLVILNDLTDLLILERRQIASKMSIVIFHNPFLDVLFQDRKRLSFSRRFLRLKEHLESFSKKRDATFVCLNSLQLKLLEENFSCSIHQISNGIDVNKYSPDLSIPHEEGLLLYVGRLDESQKRVSVLLEMMDKLNYRGFKLTVVGTGNSMKSYQEYVTNHSLAENVHFLGYVNESEKLELYRKASVLVSASVNEGMPYTFLEAMACGLPVVSYDCSAARMLISDGINGFIAQDGKTFEAAIMRLTQDRNLNSRIGENARSFVIKHHSLEKMLARYSALFDNLLSQMSS